MEGVRVFSPEDWSGSGMDGTAYAAADLKIALEGLAKHLFGTVCIFSFLVKTIEILHMNVLLWAFDSLNSVFVFTWNQSIKVPIC